MDLLNGETFTAVAPTGAEVYHGTIRTLAITPPPGKKAVVEYIAVDLTGFACGAASEVALFTSYSGVATNITAFQEILEENNLGGLDEAVVWNGSFAFERAGFVVLDVVSIDSADRVVGWSVSGHYA